MGVIKMDMEKTQKGRQMNDLITKQLETMQLLIASSFDNARKADKGFVTAGIRFRKQMKELIQQAHEVRKTVIEVRKKLDDNGKEG